MIDPKKLICSGCGTKIPYTAEELAAAELALEQFMRDHPTTESGLEIFLCRSCGDEAKRAFAKQVELLKAMNRARNN